MNAVLVISIGSILAIGSYLAVQEGATIFKPSNPVSIVLFLSGQLITRVLCIADWVRTRIHMLTAGRRERVSGTDQLIQTDQRNSLDVFQMQREL